MNTKPILFSTPMIQALLEGRKTQTRRTAKPRRTPSLLDGSWSDDYVLHPENREWLMLDCPYGRPGDLLWVRESFTVDGLERVLYRAEDHPDQQAAFPIKYRPSIHMPRWASRLTLRITDVRVQRLQEISDEDAEAEGAEWEIVADGLGCHLAGFAQLWDSINGAGAWDANPWVWAVSFEVIKANVDQVLGEAA